MATSIVEAVTLHDDNRIAPVSASTSILTLRPADANSSLPGNGRNSLQSLAMEFPTTDDLSLSTSTTITVSLTLAGTIFLSSVCTGLLTIAIPRVAVDLELADSLLLWYEQLVISAILGI
jgi:hypothetical protein